ncbi:beta-ketoacyl-ACP synthase III [Luteithermobacter gelatinilyticus]|uniref:beta-ketoacyl-ACP synthase III n=1 Tax=Luteithermobacter gelatinilyticus TaxID=2582913 RepID=UPI001105C5B1|nr:beta-ketoacyl-ACP synthase III [Luteithermobacter gelatinilyticus]|tara:strand:- start:3015 stop:3992 length:978 start_codon:yes stop_codon:yes gene_type:complete
MSVIRSVIAGCGSYLPEKVVTNKQLEDVVDTSDEWIIERTGIRQRHIAAEGELTSDLALEASKRALADADMTADELDLIILATATPDQTFPSTATRVQAALGMTHGAAFDVQAVCSGFVYALATADNFIRSGQARNVLVIGAETFSRILDWEDRTTCVLFGDGAGAVILSAHEGEGKNTDRGILTTHLHSDGRYNDLLYVDGGPSSTKSTGYLRMKGREVFRHAVKNLADVVGESLHAVGLAADDVDIVVPHQANKRILDGTAKKLGIDPEKIVMTVHKHANTSAASIPLALDEAVKQGRISTGDVVILEAMGGGFTWGACLLRW